MKTLRQLLLITVTVLVMSVLLSCNNKDAVVDYSEYPFTDTSWTRDAEHDIETIRFGSDGSFVYYCACGNPVNDSDMSDGYTYDDKTKTITIKYFETTEETVSEIVIESCDDESIRLNFDGEIREFVRNKK